MATTAWGLGDSPRMAERERLEAEGRRQDLRRDLDGLLGGQPRVELEYLLALAIAS